MVEHFWVNYPELNQEVRKSEEDELSAEVLDLREKFKNYIKEENSDHLLGDLQGGVHLLQGIIIMIQLRRMREKK